MNQTSESSYNEARLRCIAKCIFALNEEAAQILVYLIRRGRGAIVKEIARDLERNPEVVRRALRLLYSKGLVQRRPYPLRKGGRAFLYEPVPGVVDAVLRVCKYVHGVIDELYQNSRGKRNSFSSYYFQQDWGGLSQPVFY